MAITQTGQEALQSLQDRNTTVVMDPSLNDRAAEDMGANTVRLPAGSNRLTPFNVADLLVHETEHTNQDPVDVGVSGILHSLPTMLNNEVDADGKSGKFAVEWDDKTGKTSPRDTSYDLDYYGAYQGKVFQMTAGGKKSPTDPDVVAAADQAGREAVQQSITQPDTSGGQSFSYVQEYTSGLPPERQAVGYLVDLLRYSAPFGEVPGFIQNIQDNLAGKKTRG